MPDLATKFSRLFDGRIDAFGTGKGEWVKRRLEIADYSKHLDGFGHGLGIAPLRDDGTVMFAAIDLDEPDFDAAWAMAALLPGPSWVERSRSGNAHVWAFFSEPIEAYVPRGVLRLAAAAADKPHAEIFPKQDVLQPGMLGNYINLPYHGSARPILRVDDTPLSVDEFVDPALASRNDPDVWRRRARLLDIQSPSERAATAEYRSSPILHMCAAHIIEHREDNPVVTGHRSVVYFSVAKQLLNWNQIDEDEAWELLQMLEAASPDSTGERELRRIFDNARRGEWTSTGCDDPLMAPYVHPDCPIARRHA